MKKTEKILILIFILSILFMAFGILGHSALLILGLETLALLYLLFGFALLNNIRLRHIFKKESYRHLSTMRLLGSIAAGLSIALTLDGILFRIMFWTGSRPMLINGIISLVLLTAIGAFKYLKNKSPFYPRLFKRTVLLSILGLFLFFLPSEKLAAFKFPNNPAYVKALKDSWEHPNDPEYQRKVEEERRKM